MTEVTLSCMVVEPRTKVVPITIDPRKNLIYLSVAIKKAFWCELYGEAPLDLGLYLATRGDVWLTRDDPEIKALEASEEAPDVIKEIVETTVDMARIETIGDCLVGSGLPPPPSNQVHFLVDVIPYDEELARAAHKAVFPRAKLCWNEPRPLVEHPSWDIQHEAYEERSLWAMGPHYNTWKEERTSRHNNPVFYCVGGSKAGKSRLLDEFQHLLQVRVANRNTKYAARDVMIRDAFVFKISFSREKVLGCAEPVGSRMLFQLVETPMPWEEFASKDQHQFTPQRVLLEVSKIRNIPLNEMSVILCVDDMHCLPHPEGNSSSQFRNVMSTLTTLARSSVYWITVICSSALLHPIFDFRVRSGHYCLEVAPVPLTRPKLNGMCLRSLIRCYLHTSWICSLTTWVASQVHWQYCLKSCTTRKTWESHLPLKPCCVQSSRSYM